MTNEHTSLEKYIPLTLYSRKGCERVNVGYVWEVSWRRNRLPHIDAKFLWPQQHFFLILLGCSTGVLRAQALCLALALTTASCPQMRLELTASNCNSNSNLLKPSVAPGYIIVCRPPASCGRRICTEFNHVHRSRWYSDIFDKVSWLTARSKVNMLQLVTTFFLLEETFYSFFSL